MAREDVDTLASMAVRLRQPAHHGRDSLDRRVEINGVHPQGHSRTGDLVRGRLRSSVYVVPTPAIVWAETRDVARPPTARRPS